MALVSGRYQLLGQLFSDDAAVFLASDTISRKKRVLVALFPLTQDDRNKLFLRRNSILNALHKVQYLSFPNVVDVVEENGNAYLVSEYLCDSIDQYRNHEIAAIALRSCLLKADGLQNISASSEELNANNNTKAVKNNYGVLCRAKETRSDSNNRNSLRAKHGNTVNKFTGFFARKQKSAHLYESNNTYEASGEILAKRTAVVICSMLALVACFIMSLHFLRSCGAESRGAANKTASKNIANSEHSVQAQMISDDKLCALDNEDVRTSYRACLREIRKTGNANKVFSYVERSMNLQKSMLKKHEIVKISPEPLLQLLKYQIADKRWDSEEEQSFIGIMADYEPLMRKNADGWTRFTYAVGQAYWYYFAGFSGEVLDEERQSRINVASVWMEEAKNSEKDSTVAEDIKSKITLYCEVADLYSRLNNTDSNNNSEYYVDYIEKISSLLKLSEKNSNDMIRLDSSELVMESVQSWVPAFKWSGISSQKVLELVNNAVSCARETNVTNEECMKRKQHILDIENAVKQYVQTTLT